MKAIAYVRVSTLEQATEGVSLDAQTERLEAYCKMQGLELAGLVREEAVSGSIPLHDRPGGQDLLRMVKEHKAKHVVALKLDRLFRDAEDALRQTKEWDKAGTALHLVDMGGQTLNTASATGRFFLNVMAGFAELERNLIAERTTAALAHKKRHKQAYSPTPYGYDRTGEDLIINLREQDILHKLQTWRATGESFWAIAGRLNNTSVPSKKGGRWYATTVRKMLRNDLHKEVA
jgi:DNA invertase Pin-like site-specific DNA recombinase